MIVGRWEEFVVSGKDPKITLSYEPAWPADCQTCFVFWNDLNGVAEKIPCCNDGRNVFLTGNFGDTGSVIAYYEHDNRDAREIITLASDYGKTERCSYCNCKLDSTKTHCASCGAPC
jgi:hypothetical protein